MAKSKYPGFKLVTLAQLRARVSNGWALKIYYCASKQEPSEDKYFDCVDFNNLTVLNIILNMYKRELCNEENGKKLNFYYKE